MTVGRPCSVCGHPERAEIDAALIHGESFRNVSKRWHVSPAAAFRHRGEHLAEQVTKAAQMAEAEDVRQALDIVQQLKAINGASLQVLQSARQSGDGLLALRAVDRIRHQIELQAKLLGELDERPIVNVLLTPEWLAVRGVILDVLRDHQPLRLELVRRLRAIEPA